MDSATQIKEHAFRCLESSQLFREICAGALPHQALNQVFGHYYFWRNALHKWLFGLCIEKSPPVGRPGDAATATVLATLCGHIPEDINHLNLYKRFLTTIGVEVKAFMITAPTTAYIDSFRARFRDVDLSRSCAALAGHELLSSIHSDLIRVALYSRYGVDDLGFWNAHIENEETHFWRMWTPLTELGADESTLVSAAMNEIERHVGFWDDLCNHSIAQVA